MNTAPPPTGFRWPQWLRVGAALSALVIFTAGALRPDTDWRLTAGIMIAVNVTAQAIGGIARSRPRG